MIWSRTSASIPLSTRSSSAPPHSAAVPPSRTRRGRGRAGRGGDARAIFCGGGGVAFFSVPRAQARHMFRPHRDHDFAGHEREIILAVADLAVVTGVADVKIGEWQDRKSK